MEKTSQAPGLFDSTELHNKEQKDLTDSFSKVRGQKIQGHEVTKEGK